MTATLFLRPLHRVIVAIDIEGSTLRTNPAKAWLRHATYGLVEHALRESGITDQYHDPLIDRGDGVLVLIQPVDQVPKTVLFTAFVPTLTELLTQHNRTWSSYRFRIRVAIHAGEVHYDRRGPFGEAIDIACRILDAPEVKAKLWHTTAPLVLAISDDIYRSIVRHGYNGVGEQAFRSQVNFEIGRHRQFGWM
jgi:hypothetical protein